MNQIKIVLPLPDKRLSPNARAPHYMVLYEAKKKAREDTALATCAAMLYRPIKPMKPKWKTATVRAIFYVRDMRSIADPDNALASLKAHFDGLKDAGLIADDSGLTHLPVKFVLDRDDPRLELVVSEGAA